MYRGKGVRFKLSLFDSAAQGKHGTFLELHILPRLVMRLDYPSQWTLLIQTCTTVQQSSNFLFCVYSRTDSCLHKSFPGTNQSPRRSSRVNWRSFLWLYGLASA